MIKEIINPPVGSNKVIGPPFNPAKIGIPMNPKNVYMNIDNVLILFPKIKPARIAKNVCRDSGTDVPPIGIAQKGNQTVVFPPIAIKQMNKAPNVKCIGLIRMSSLFDVMSLN